MSESYPIGTIADMACIPEEALPRFLAELPFLLSELRRLQTIVDTVNDGMEAPAFSRIDAAGCKWVDDDKRTITQTVTLRQPDGSSEVLMQRKGTFKLAAGAAA